MSVPDGTGAWAIIYNRHVSLAMYYFISLFYII